MKDDAGDAVVDDLEGYELKEDQIGMRLAHLGVAGVPVTFYNARSDEPEALTTFIFSRIEGLRSRLRGLAGELIDTVQNVVENHDKEQYRAVLAAAAKRLNVWIASHQGIEATGHHAHEALLDAIRKTHVGSIRASVRRGGDWHNLDYEHELGFGARRIAAASVVGAADEFRAIAKNLVEDSDLVDAHGFVVQAVQTLKEAEDELLRKVQEAGPNVFAEKLKGAPLWRECVSEWGQGPGYRDRVFDHNREWFEDESIRSCHEFIVGVITRGWNDLVAKLESVIRTASEVSGIEPPN